METRREILIVDDQALNRKILTKMLQENYSIIQCSNGKEALEILRQSGEEISAVLLDLMMPVMDGYEVLEVMHKDEFLSQIPVLVTSQSDEEESELRALNLGASDFVSKPYKRDILKKRLLNLIERREATEIADVLERDVLTNLYNKQAFCHKVRHVIHRNVGVRYIVIASDIVNFKLFNDTYGTREGDKMLRYVGETIQKVLAYKKYYAARVYADQFLISLREDQIQIQEFVESCNKLLVQYPMDMKMSMKVGVYQITDDAVSVNAMCDRAVIASKSIKHSFDKSYAYYDETIIKRLLLEKQISDDMKTALAEEQFQVYLQPKYDIASRKMAGAEALVRWIHPEKGFMSPGDFIPVFEKNGFITELDMFVWEKTCAFISEWLHKYGKCVPVSVNVSRKDIYNPDLTQYFKDLVAKYNIDPKHLHLEITESAYTENSEQLISVVGKLKEAGFIIEMDDFGSGYSSLNMLSELPIDILKLDMKFIRNCVDHGKNVCIMTNIIAMAKGMDLKVIAEGVEEEHQVELLGSMGCDMAQGYFFSRPIPSGDFEELLVASELA